MQTIIAGSRNFADYQQLVEVMAKLPWKPSVIISGMAQGADRLGERWAAEHNVPTKQYPADWSTYGHRAGTIRNSQMAQVGEALVAFWNGESRGTADMIDQMSKAGGKIVTVIRFKPIEFRPPKVRTGVSNVQRELAPPVTGIPLLRREWPPLERKRL